MKIEALHTTIPVSRRKIIEFGLLLFIMFSIVIPAGVTWHNDWTWLPWLNGSIAVGGVILVLCLSTGMAMAPVYRLWMRFALILGAIMTAIILSVVFFLVITPIGLVRKMLGSKSDYVKKLDAGATTYWIDRTTPFKPGNMEKMY